METEASLILPVTKPALKIRNVECFAFMPDGERLVVSKTQATADARIVALATGDEILRMEKLPPSVHRIAVSENGRLIAFGHQHRSVTVCDAGTGGIAHKIKVANKGEISGLLFVPGSETLIHATWEGLSVIDAGSGSVINSLQPTAVGTRPPMNSALAFSPLGDNFAVCCTTFENPELFQWELQRFAWPSCALVDRAIISTRALRIVFARDGESLVVRTADKTVQVRPVSDLSIAEPDILIGESFTIGSRIARGQFGELCFSPDGSLFAFVQLDLLGLWDWKSRRLLGKWRLPDEAGTAQIAFSPQGDRIVAEVYRGVLVYAVADLLASPS